MKKIASILISLLFVASTLGVSSVMANGVSCEENLILEKTTVQVGDTFTFFLKDCVCILTSSPEYEFKTLDDGRWDFGVAIVEANIPTDGGLNNIFQAVSPGTITLRCFCSSTCQKEFTIAVVPKEYPMDQFMKILEKNKNK